MIITIDGPAASGKSSVASELAQRLGFCYLYSGMLYRAVAYVLVHEYGYDAPQLQNPVREDLAAVVSQLCYSYSSACGITITYAERVLDLVELKHEEIDDAASRVGACKELRLLLAEIQHTYAQQVGNVIADGRDCGTAVFPQATLKIFLTASREVRVLRWQHGRAAHGEPVSYEEAVQMVTERDRRDMSRAYFPLRPAADAWCIDTSELSIEQVVNMIAQRVSTLQGK